jgi:hypothetical protein
MKRTKEKPPTKARPTNVKALVMALNSDKQLDQRTTSAKAIKEIKKAVRENLDETAQALLESDVAHAAVIQKMALEQAFKDPSKAIRPDGKPHYALNSFAKFANLKKSALLALRKFQLKEPQKDDNKGLAEMVLEVSEENVSP